MPPRSLTGKAWRALIGHEPRKVSRWCYPSDFEPDTKEPPVVRWRKVVLGPDGPASPTTRFVLLALSYHMDERGGSCFPSCDLLTKEMRLSKRAVVKHLQFAEAEGWIERTMAMGHGKGWKRAEYQATVPYFGGDARSPRTKHRSKRKVDPMLGGYSDDTSW
jgi:hypothetical protein